MELCYQLPPLFTRQLQPDYFNFLFGKYLEHLPYLGTIFRHAYSYPVYFWCPAMFPMRQHLYSQNK